MGIIQHEKDKAIVDFKRILDLDSDVVLLTIRKKLNPEIPKHLLSRHIDKNPDLVDRIISSNIEVALDYGNLWHKDFDQFNVRDIEFSFNLEIGLETIINELSGTQRKKIIQAGKALGKGKKDAITYMKIFSDNFLKFQNDEFQPALMNCITLEPENNFQIKSIQSKMQSCEIAGVGQPVVLPGSMKIFFECRLEGKDVVLKGKITVDLDKFSKVLRKITSSIEQQTSNLKLN